MTRTLITVLAIVCLMGADEQKKSRYYYEHGTQREKEKRIDDALDDYTRAVNFDPGFIEAWSSRSVLFAKQNQYAKSIADLTKIIELKPGDYPALFNRGLYSEYIGENDRAIADYSAIIQGQPDFSRSELSRERNLARTYYHRGWAHLQYTHNYRQAVADLTKALELDPKTQSVHYRRAECYHALKEYEKADEDYQIALKKDREFVPLLDAWAWQMATCPDAKCRNGKRAVEMSLMANSGLNYKIPKLVDTLAAAYAEAGAFDKAIETSEKALQNLPANKSGLEKGIRQRLELYRAGRPYREE